MTTTITARRAGLFAAALLFAASAQASTLLGTWRFVGTRGVLQAQLFTDDAAPGASNLLSALVGRYYAAGDPFGVDASLSPIGLTNSFGLPTDNLWLGSDPLAPPHVTTGGFGFRYTLNPPATQDGGDILPYPCCGSFFDVFVELSIDGGMVWAPTGEAPEATLAYKVPEPATWALLVTGFGLIGTALRRRTRDALIR